MQQLFSAHLTTLSIMLRFVEQQALQRGFKADEWLSLQVAVDEALMNVLQHAGLDSHDQIEIQCNTPERSGIEVVIIDQGKPFNPLVNQSREAPAEGGYGLPLMRGLMDQIIYKRENKFNQLTLIKYLGTLQE